jgi:deoxyadenosine/deoxycytidine kinase
MYLAIDGVIGVGKTSLARLLQPAFGAALLLEVFEENPFLSDFYGDRARYAFQTQIFFLLSRYHQQRAAPGLLADRAYERQMDPAYIGQLCAAYDDFFAAPDGPRRQAPVLTLETEHLDFVNNPAHLRQVGAVQVPLPFGGPA